MKKVILYIVVMVALTVLLCGCGEHTVVSVDGIDNCRLKSDSDYELGWFLLPEDLLGKYEYLDADYHFRVKTCYIPWFSDSETMVLEVTYEPEIYIQAKEYCLQEMELSETGIIEYNGYTFIENLGLKDVNGFPRCFNMLVYNDDLNGLVFMGFVDYDYYIINGDKYTTENWGQFLEEKFSDIYDFGSVESNDLTKG